jgi:predicted nucleotide-binding protein
MGLEQRDFGMARRTTSAPPPPERPALSIEQKRRVIDRLRKRIQMVEAFDTTKLEERFSPEVRVVETSIEEVLVAAFGKGTDEYRRYSGATTLDGGPLSMGGFGGPSNEAYEAQKYVEEGKKRAVLLLNQAISFLEEEIVEDDHEASAAASPAPVSRTLPNRVFLVHGHDEEALQSVARFLEQMGLDPIVLREQPDRGRTIIEKFEECAGQVGFAVILMTPDDLTASSTSGTAGSRARQNVIFELGYFAGKLGRGRTCLLRRGDVEIPSDLYGVIYSDYDDAGAWKMKLVQELKAARLTFDANKMWG